MMPLYCTLSCEFEPHYIQAGENNYLLTYDSYVPLYNRFHGGEWIPPFEIYYTRAHKNQWSIGSFM